VACTWAECGEWKGVLEWHHLGEPLHCIVAPSPKPSFLHDITDDESLPTKPLKRRLPASALCEQEKVLLLALEEAHDIVLVAFDAVVLGVFLDVRFLLPLADHISDRESGLRAMVEELESPLSTERLKAKALFNSAGYQ